MIEVDGSLAGQARLDALNTADRRGWLAIGLLQESDLGRGIGRRAIELLPQEAFGPMDLHRVELRVLAYCGRAIRYYEACGFSRDGIKRESALIDGAWQCGRIMSILKQDFRVRAPAPGTGS